MQNANNEKELELNYESAINILNCMSCMNIGKEKTELYLAIAKQFSELSGYKDADECVKKCKQLAKQSDEEFKNKIYEIAKSKKNTAKNAQDYQSAVDEFEKITGYKDANNMASECKQLSVRIGNKDYRKRLVISVAVVCCIVALIIGSTTSHAKYYLANALVVTGSYDTAIDIYQKLGPYKDCKDRLIQCQYKYGLELKADGNIEKAVDALEEAGNYKDSEILKLSLEKNIFRNSKIGDKVELGNCKWLILDIKDDQALLMKNGNLEDRPYNDTSENVTWENSSIRKWLNSDFLNETFSELELKNISLTNVKNVNNETYGTVGGNETQDYAFLLSIDEINKYNNLFPKFTSISWLRSPGNNQKSAAFLLMNGSVMDYGYAITSQEIKVRPALWFKIDK